MGQLPPIFKEINNPDAPRHLGAILRGFQALCGKVPENDLDLVAWVSTRGWNPGDGFCAECAALYRKGFAWNPALDKSED